LSPTTRIAYKRLSAVEVDPDSSHQHEFHADALRRQLGFGDERVSGNLRLAIYGSDEVGDAISTRGTFTLYDARQAHATRTEWRLYYSIPELEAAQPGDLLVLFREPDDFLSGIVARPGSVVEAQLVRLLEAGAPIDPGRFRFRDSPVLAPDDAASMREAMAPTPATPMDYPNAVADLIAGLAVRGEMPTTLEMAELAAMAVSREHGDLVPDLAVYHGLQGETDIFFALEDRVYSPRLAQLQASRADLAEVSSFILGLVQSRRSRRGQSLQNHFARLLRLEGIPHAAQCETEPGERPDFVFPGCAEYHDRAFPSARLQMVACKSTARERWRQVLNEAVRIPEKHLLTVDGGLTLATVAAMRSAAISVFMPSPIITSRYPSDAWDIGTVGELIERLHATAGARA
jgi:hypothetical protein